MYENKKSQHPFNNMLRQLQSEAENYWFSNPDSIYIDINGVFIKPANSEASSTSVTNSAVPNNTGVKKNSKQPVKKQTLLDESSSGKKKTVAKQKTKTPFKDKKGLKEKEKLPKKKSHQQLLNSRSELVKHYYKWKKSCEEYDKFKYAPYQEQNLAKYSTEKDQNYKYLNDSLKENEFGSIRELEAYIHNYQEDFEKQTLALAEEALQSYSQQLKDEENRLNNNTYLAALYEQLVSSGAKEHYAAAAEKSQEAIGIMRDLGGYASGDLERKGQLQKQSRSQKQEGAAAVKTMVSPLVQEKHIDHETLAGAKDKEDLKRILKKYILNKQNNIADTRQDLKENPVHIYELDQLVQASLKKHERGNILHQIVQHKTDELSTEKTIKAVAITVVTTALTILIFGGATPFLLAGVGSAGLSLYGVYEAVEDYRQKNAANNVGLLSEDPSLIWVLLAIAGAGVDSVALQSAFKSAGPLVKVTKAFNEGGTLAELDRDLAKIFGLNDRIKSNIYKQAKTRSKIREDIANAAKAREDTKRVLNSTKNLHSTIEPFSAIIAKASVAAYYLIKRGVHEINIFLNELKAAHLIDDFASLSDKERQLIKEIFYKTKSIQNADEITIEAMEKAIAEKDFSKLRYLIDEFDVFNESKSLALKIRDEVKISGKFKKTTKYHADSTHQYTDFQVKDIIINSERIYLSQNNSKIIYFRNGDIVVVEASGSGAGNVITAYGHSGIKGKSGAEALGGLATEQGTYITEQMILEGKIATKKGFIDAAKLIYP